MPATAKVSTKKNVRISGLTKKDKVQEISVPGHGSFKKVKARKSSSASKRKASAKKSTPWTPAKRKAAAKKAAATRKRNARKNRASSRNKMLYG